LQGRLGAPALFLSINRNARLFQIIDDLKPVVLFCNFAIILFLKSRRGRPMTHSFCFLRAGGVGGAIARGEAPQGGAQPRVKDKLETSPERAPDFI